MRYSEFKKINEDLDGILNAIMGKAGVNVAAFNKTETDKLAAADKPATPSTEKPTTPSTEKPTTPSTEKPTTPEPQTSVTVSNGYTPKGATPEQMKQFGPSSKDKINWREMRSYIANKLSFNHAVAMVVNCKWESGWQPGRWVHSDASQGPSGGLFMFHDLTFSGKGFFSSMAQACGGPGKWQTNWQGQIDFALSSRIGKGPAFAARTFKSPEEATYWFCVEFERPQDKEAKGRERAKEAQLYSK
jgi:hypothetical protein